MKLFKLYMNSQQRQWITLHWSINHKCEQMNKPMNERKKNTLIQIALRIGKTMFWILCSWHLCLWVGTYTVHDKIFMPIDIYTLRAFVLKKSDSYMNLSHRVGCIWICIHSFRYLHVRLASAGFVKSLYIRLLQIENLAAFLFFFAIVNTHTHTPSLPWSFFYRGFRAIGSEAFKTPGKYCRFFLCVHLVIV